MTYFRRGAWGARPVPHGTRMDTRRVEGIALHWPGDDVRRESVPEVMAALRAWQRQHIDVNGWRDIAYQEAVDQAGNVYRLRGFAYESAANGDTDTNDRFGALLLVLAIGERPSPQMMSGARRAIRRHQARHERSSLVVPHSAIRPAGTQCPGDLVRQLIKAGEFDPKRRK